MNLLIDIGNSHFKWSFTGVEDMPREVHYQPVDALTAGFLDTVWQDDGPPERVLIANVRGDMPAAVITNWCQSTWNIRPLFVQVTREFDGLVCGYEDISQLGVDRWLALIAAWMRKRQACCVVDCGTAVTIDAIDNSGRHLGGLILPGVGMMQDMLCSHTHGIDAQGKTGVHKLFATGTRDAVASGTILAVSCSINHARSGLQALTGELPPGLLTGGGSAGIRPYLEGDYEYVETLVLEGLQHMALTI